MAVKDGDSATFSAFPPRDIRIMFYAGNHTPASGLPAGLPFASSVRRRQFSFVARRLSVALVSSRDKGAKGKKKGRSAFDERIGCVSARLLGLTSRALRPKRLS